MKLKRVQIGFISQDTDHSNPALKYGLETYSAQQYILFGESLKSASCVADRTQIIGTKGFEDLVTKLFDTVKEKLESNEIILNIGGALPYQVVAADFVASLTGVDTLLDYNLRTKRELQIPVPQRSYNLSGDEKNLLATLHRAPAGAKVVAASRRLIEKGLATIKGYKGASKVYELTSAGCLIAPLAAKL